MKRLMGSKAALLNLRTIGLGLALVAGSSAYASGGISALYEKFSPEKQFPIQTNCHPPIAGKDASGKLESMADNKGYVSSIRKYRLPEVSLLTMEGKETTLERELDTDKPVLLNFIFTSCTTICPVMSASFYQVQHELGDASQEVKMISISIDPEFDTPEKLRDYADRFDAGPQWQFLTGEVDNIVSIEKAFDAFRGAKMNHEPLTLIRAKVDEAWLRIDGIASANDILKEYRDLVE
jgi:protein SCO1/2